MTRAQIEINKLSPSTDFHLQILATNASGVPVDGVLGSAAIPDASVPLGVTTLDGTFSSPAPVVAGHTYALVVTRPGGNNYPISERGGDTCAGQEFTSNFQTGGFGPSDPAFDHIFQVFVTPTNQFTIGALVKRQLHLIVPGPGTISVIDGKLLKPVQTTAGAAGEVVVTLRLTKRGKARLKRKGKVKALGAITYTPTGGEPNTQQAKLKIKRKARRR